MSDCKECHYSHVCSDRRKTFHKEGCEHFDKRESNSLYPGGSPPLKFCPICKHDSERCICETDLEMFARNNGLTIESVRDCLLNHNGFILTDYHMLEGQCMTYCDRFEEKD